MASVKNAAARFNVTPEYVRKLCRTGKICYTAISSRKWLVNMDTLAQFFAQGEPVREDSQQVTNGLVLDSDMLLDDLIDRWFEEYANKQLKAKTLYDYRRMRGRISAGLGHLKVSKIKPAHVMAFYNNLEEKGVRRDSTYTATKALLKLLPRGTRGELAKQAGIGQDTMRMVYAGKRVSRKTAEKVSAAVGLTFSKAFVEHTKKDGKLNNNSVIRYQAMLSSIFKKGVQWGLINENPCSRAEHPKAEEIDVRVLTEEEIPKLLDALLDAPPQYSVITQLALLLGVRRGEICALRWSDIDFEKGTLSIKRTVQSIPGIGLVFNTPKTRRGKRCLRIGADCVELLQEYRRYQKAERFRIGSAWVRKVTLENGKVVVDMTENNANTRSTAMTRAKSNLTIDLKDRKERVYSIVGWGQSHGEIIDNNDIVTTGNFNDGTLKQLQRTLWKGHDSKPNNLDNRDLVRDTKHVNTTIAQAYINNQGQHVTITDAELYLTFLTERAGYLTSIGYYYYKTNEVPNSESY